ncbi:anthranilate phosphoribosyltransferase family protein [Cyanobium sp. WAJ14-Wanaka]|uniref:anthranilate phosphoribosyltransferase family protein n=1 Tax=Cyanobium sp. WAJ14-Wanaka TaxID=2823725 RepID=UPI0020CB8BB7|nr:anthranilate phosphoribosyltransferase family protein [Cyanobium sp. WAJ14-Wanaka]MCP9775500.1 anthranilate phosphoribosyltransferase family protein [Cyanobium sp. WAJ14-Wanaka]
MAQAPAVPPQPKQDAKIPGRDRFRTYLGKVGSGEHTSSGLSRGEAADALELMLNGEASPAQIGAFLIAHRIRRPEPQELTGMLDVYRQLGPKLISNQPALCFGIPFDGRSRTSPIYPLTSLLLASAGIPVVLQGGGRMPVKYGVTAMELFAALGLALRDRSVAWVQNCLDLWNLALIHQPDHFPAAEVLVPIREDIGKRPPVASLELLWTAHRGNHLLVSGFVHPPTEARAWQALKLAGETEILTIKGLEGSTDLPISRACVTGRPNDSGDGRLILHPRDHDCYGNDPAWIDLDTWADQALAALGGQGPLATSLIWNAGNYLWQAGLSNTQEAGLESCRKLLHSGKPLGHLAAIHQHCS